MQEGTRRLRMASPARSGHSCVRDGSLRTSFAVSERDLAELADDVVQCRRERASQWVSERRNILQSADPRDPATPLLIGHLAQWTDGSSSLRQEVAGALGRFSGTERERLPIRGYLFLRLAQGVVAFASGQSGAGDLDFVITVGAGGCGCEDLVMLAHLWKADADRGAGALDGAMRHARLGGELAAQAGYQRLAAKAQVTEGFSMLDAGLPHAGDLLQRAESVLEETEDWLWQGRIQDGFGRAVLAEGHYRTALDRFVKARDLFEKGRESHPELGWAHFNMARAQRLIASRLGKSIDSSAELHRSFRAQSIDCSGTTTTSRQHLEQLREEASSALACATNVFRATGDDRALDTVCLERGALSADCGDLHHAAEHAQECFAGASRNKDALLMAQARLLNSRIEMTRCEEGVGLNLAHHAQLAYESAGEALALALPCEAKPSAKRRLVASIYVCQGLLLLNEFFNNTEGAHECCRRASEYISPSERNELWDDYQVLVSKALHSGSTDSKLRKWCEGLAEGKTFQQITEEFADLVIPAVWAREGKNVSRVVARLSISPKKVRRILARVGLKE